MPADRPHDVHTLTTSELQRTRRDLQISLALAFPGSPVRVPILAQMTANSPGAQPGEMTVPDPRAYIRLAALLRGQITTGMLAPGAQLTPIGELRRQHGHSRQTVTKAMSILQDEGLIRRWPGLGTT